MLFVFLNLNLFVCSDRTLYQIRSDPSVHDRQRDLKFARAPSKRQKVKSRRERKPDSNDRTEEKIEAKVPDNLASEVKKPDEDYEEIELDQPYDERYVSCTNIICLHIIVCSCT